MPLNPLEPHLCNLVFRMGEASDLGLFPKRLPNRDLPMEGDLIEPLSRFQGNGLGGGLVHFRRNERSRETEIVEIRLSTGQMASIPR